MIQTAPPHLQTYKIIAPGAYVIAPLGAIVVPANDRLFWLIRSSARPDWLVVQQDDAVRLGRGVMAGLASALIDLWTVCHINLSLAEQSAISKAIITPTLANDTPNSEVGAIRARCAALIAAALESGFRPLK